MDASARESGRGSMGSPSSCADHPKHEEAFACVENEGGSGDFDFLEVLLLGLQSKL